MTDFTPTDPFIMKCLKCKDTGKVPSNDMLICEELCGCRAGKLLKRKIAKILERER